jgi:hypothetical protein
LSSHTSSKTDPPKIKKPLVEDPPKLKKPKKDRAKVDTAKAKSKESQVCVRVCVWGGVLGVNHMIFMRDMI